MVAAASPFADPELPPADEGGYARISAPALITDIRTGKAEITEFFAYGCHYCRSSEEPFRAWLDRHRADVVVLRLPID